MWKQWCILSTDFHLEGEFAIYWNTSKQSIQTGHVLLREELDMLIWTKSKVGGTYIKQVNYEIYVAYVSEDPCWWCSIIWKVRTIKETKILMWLTIQNKIPTWDYL